jgi:3-oxoacyl-[acyl-carrier-protein] synthase-3
MRYDDVALAGLSAELPSVVLRTADVEERLRPLYRRLGFTPGWVEAVTGIAERRMWAPGERFVDGAVRASRRALVQARVDPRCVQAVISCSVYKDRLEPSLACEVQGALGIPYTAVNFDVANACLGFLTGLVTVANMISVGQIECGLVVASEDAGPVLEATLRQLEAPGADIHGFKAHLATLTLGSAAAAAVVTRASLVPGPRLLGGASLSATEHRQLCMGDARGMQTDSVQLLREGVALASRTWSEVRETLGWSGEDVSMFAMHQVGKAHHDAVTRALQVEAARSPPVYGWLGNVGSCGVPVTASTIRDRGLVRAGESVALMGIGSGLNCMMLGLKL